MVIMLHLALLSTHSFLFFSCADILMQLHIYYVYIYMLYILYIYSIYTYTATFTVMATIWRGHSTAYCCTAYMQKVFAIKCRHIVIYYKFNKFTDVFAGGGSIT